MSAMPECDRLIASFRAQSNVGEAIGCAHEAINALRAALLAAEARVREVEEERDIEYRKINDKLTEILPHVTALRADLKAAQELEQLHLQNLDAAYAERDALVQALADADVLVGHYEGYAVTAAIRANVTDLRVGVKPEILAAGERYRVRREGQARATLAREET